MNLALGIVINRAVPILKTKLQPSFGSSNLLPRQRLLQLLPAGAQVRLILLHALAGAGKSSLLYDCMRRGLLDGAWYSLSEEDRDPFVFFSYVLTTLDEKYRGLARGAWKYLEQGGEKDWDALTTALVNLILAHGSQVNLILDDYHVVQDVQAIASAVNKLVRHGPANFTLVLSTRERPTLPLTSLQAKGRLLELKPQDLLFSQDEILEFFRQVWDQDMDPGLAQILLEKTEGWVTGLQLTAQALGNRSKESARAYIEGLHGQDDVVYQYIASEVFLTQPQEVQNFLLATSIVDSFSSELASQLSGNPTPLSVLDHLDKTRLFLVHLDQRGEWFRYHHLFRDFLLRRLDESRTFPPQQLHARAGQWYQEREEWVKAIHHFLSGDDLGVAADLLEQEGGRMLERGLHATFREQLAKLPRKWLDDRVGLWLHQADLQELDGQWPQAIEGYKRCLQAYRSTGAENEAVAVLEKLSLTYVKYGETAQLMAVCEEGLQSCQEDSLRSLLSAWLGVALVSSGMDWDRGYSLLALSHELAYRCGNPRAISWACMVYGFGYHMPRGNFSQAARVLREGIAFFRKMGWPAIISQLSMNLALTHIVAGELDLAEEIIDTALQKARESGITYMLRGLENLRAMVLLERREFTEAEACLREVQKTDIPVQMKPWFFRNQALLLQFLGNPGQARVACEEMLSTLDMNGYGMYAPECLLSLAYIEWKQGHDQEALTQARRALEIAEKAQAKFWQMKSHQILAALRGEASAGLDHLRQAIELSDANAYHAHWREDAWQVSGSLLTRARAHKLLHGDSPLHEMGPREVALPKTAAALIEVRALGGLELRRNNSTILPGSYVRPRVLLLFKYFLAHPDRLLPADVIIEHFWPDLPGEKARAALNTHISLVRKTCRPDEGEPPVLHREGDGYRLREAPLLDLDVRKFRYLVERAKIHSRDGQVGEAVKIFLQAEKLYGGDFLEDDRYEDFIIHERRRLRDQYEHLLEYLADFLSTRGSAEEAIEKYRKALQSEEPAERILQKLLHCCVANGDLKTALSEFERFKEVTDDAGGLRLDRSTGALYRKILKKNQDDSRAPGQ